MTSFFKQARKPNDISQVEGSKRLATNTAWMMSGQGLRLLIQAVYFTAVARSLGTANYGAFVGVAAFIGIAVPFGALGSGNLLIRDVVRAPETFRTAWGTALLRSFLLGATLTIFACTLARFVLPTDLSKRLVLLVAIADILGLNLTLMSAFAFQALEKLSWTSVIYVGISFCRLAAALILITFHPHPSALTWGYAYLGSTLVAMVFAFVVAVRKLGWPKFLPGRAISDLREGLFFATGMSAQTIYNDLDKTMLARFSTLDATGIYGAAYRVIEVCFTPVVSLLSAAYPQFFRVGLGGIKASWKYALPLMRNAFLASSLICVVLMFSAGLLPAILGRQYAAAATALRWLALILPLRSVHAFLSDVLTSAGRQGLRTTVQIGVAVLNGIMNLWAIRAYSWKGAVATSLISDAFLVAAVATAVRIVLRQTPGLEAESAASASITEERALV